MTGRESRRIAVGMMAFIVGSAIVVPAAPAGLARAKPYTVLAATCDCSKCRSNQVCCRTANGACGCFPAGIKC